MDEAETMSCNDEDGPPASWPGIAADDDDAGWRPGDEDDDPTNEEAGYGYGV